MRGRFTFFERKLVDAFFFLTLVFCFVLFFCQTDQNIEKANNLYIREVSVMDTVHLVKPGFQRRYGGDGNYPADFPVRSK